MAHAAPRSLVTIADQMMHEEDIDADEYLWETLPGRCCFQELADDVQMVLVKTCTRISSSLGRVVFS